MKDLEHKLRESSERERDFSPTPEQWAALKSRLADGPAHAARTGRFKAVKIGVVLALIALGVSAAFILYLDQPAEEDRYVPTGGQHPATELAATTRLVENWAENAGEGSAALQKEIVEAVQKLQRYPVQTRSSETSKVAEQKIFSPLATPVTPAHRFTTEPELTGLADAGIAGRASDTFGTLPAPVFEYPAIELGTSDTSSAATPVLHSLPSLPVVEINGYGRPAELPVKINSQAVRKKRPAPVHWYLSGGFHAMRYVRESLHHRYQTAPNGSTPLAFPLPGSNEWLELYLLEKPAVFNSGHSFDRYYSLSAGRQFRSGLDLSIGATYYHEPDPKQQLMRRLPYEPGLAYLVESQYSQILYGRIDLRYIFLRRHRLRPYLGVAMVGIFYETAYLDKVFYFPERSIEQAVSSQRFTGRDFFYAPVPIPRGGLQYDLSRRWQLGAEILGPYPGLLVQYNFR